MHTKGKWTVSEEPYYLKIGIRTENEELIIETYKYTTDGKNGLDNAKHIVQMHNSFDRLLEALKYAEENYDSERLNGAIYDKIKAAIAEAESIE